jgi:hypothetical protein
LSIFFRAIAPPVVVDFPDMDAYAVFIFKVLAAEQASGSICAVLCCLQDLNLLVS